MPHFHLSKPKNLGKNVERGVAINTDIQNEPRCFITQPSLNQLVVVSYKILLFVKL